MIIIIGGAGNTCVYFLRFIQLLKKEFLQPVEFIPIDKFSTESVDNIFEDSSIKILIGFSLGANAALRFAKEREVNKLILISPVSIFNLFIHNNDRLETAQSYRPLKPHWWKDLKFLKRTLLFIDQFVVGRSILRQVYLKMNPNSPKIVVDEIHREGYGMLLQNIESNVTQFEMTEALDRTKARSIRIICGDADEFLHLSKVLETTLYDPRIQVRICKGDHHILLTNPKDVIWRLGSLFGI